MYFLAEIVSKKEGLENDLRRKMSTNLVHNYQKYQYISANAHNLAFCGRRIK